MLVGLICLRQEKWEKMGYVICCGPFPWRTALASHFLGPPWCSSFPKSSIEQWWAAYIPQERGGVGWDSCWGCWWSCPHSSTEGRGKLWGVGSWLEAHCRRVVVVVVVVDEPAVDLEFKLCRNAQRLHMIPKIIWTIKVLKPDRY